MNTESLIKNIHKFESDIEGLNSSLDTKAKQNKRVLTHSNTPRIVKVTFIDDDGAKGVYTRLRPIFQSKNVPCNCAIITGMIGDSLHMTEQQLKECYDLGWEFLGHGNYYQNNISEFTTDKDLDNDLKTCRDWLNTRGYDVRGFVYPQNVSDVRIRSYVRKYYDFSFGNVGINMGEFIDTMKIMRISFGSWTDNNPTINGNSEKNTLAYYKACVDYAETNKAWLVWMMHVDSQTVEQDTILGQLIDYIKSKNVDIVTASEGYTTFGNGLFVGDTSNKYFAVNENGVFSSEAKIVIDDFNISKPSKLFADYKNNSITYCYINNSESSILPENSGGVLITYKINNKTNGEIVYNYQEFVTVYKLRTYRRYVNADGTWGSWVTNLFTEFIAIDSKVITSAPSSYPRNSMTVMQCSDSYVVNNSLPGGAKGVLTTYRFNDTTCDYQIFRPNGKSEYIRYTSGDAWTSWIGSGYYNIVGFNAFTNDTLASAYPSDKIITFHANASAGYPSSGIVTIYRVGGNEWTKMELRKHVSKDVLTRWVDSNGDWTAWV